MPKRECCNQEIYEIVSDRLNVSVSQVRDIAKFISRYSATRISIGKLDTTRYPYLGALKPSIKKLQKIKEHKSVIKDEQT